MNKRLKIFLSAALASLVIVPVILMVIGAGVGWAVMGEVIVIDVFLTMSITVLGLVE